MDRDDDPAACPVEVPRAVMVQRWETLTFLHWPYEAASVQRLLPPWLEVETCEGSAWVGLVPFFMRVGLPGVPSVPWLSRFCETNVRTYVREPRTGQSGIWFFSLDAARLAPVMVARAAYGLPYVWSRMHLTTASTLNGSSRVRYTSRRRWPRSHGARSDVAVEVGEALDGDSLGGLDHFLTARWALFSETRRHRYLGWAWHAPWPLHRARVLSVDDELVEAAGVSAPRTAPLVHYSPGVDVRIGPLEPADRR